MSQRVREREERIKMEIVVFYCSSSDSERFNVLDEMMDTPVTERVMIQILIRVELTH